MYMWFLKDLYEFSISIHFSKRPGRPPWFFLFLPMISNRELFLRHVAQTSEEPMMVEVERAEGVYLYGPDGKSYLDMISGIGVSNVGHCAPEVVRAIQEQVGKFMHTMVYGEFILAPQVQLAEMLTGLLGDQLDNIYFVNSGSEAVEGALKLAKKFTGRSEIIAFHKSYHGSTHGALSVTGSPGLREGYGPFLEGIRFLDFNDGGGIEEITAQTACVIVEPVQGEAGVIEGYPCFIMALRERCTATGTLLIFDEIQTGFGRTGSLFAHQRYRVQPDILLLAKSMGGGMPMGAFISRKEIMNVLTNNPVLGHITTFGGHPVTCAAALASLKKIIDEDLVAKIPARERLIRQLLDHPNVKGLRGRGLIFAVEVGGFEQVLKVVKRCLELGLITDWFLNCDTAIRLAPPLVITEEELQKGLEIVLQAIGEMR